MTSIVESIKTSCTAPDPNRNYFGLLTDEQQKIIEKNKVVVEYKKGEIIAKQGSFTTHLLNIKSGLVKVYYEDGNKILILRIVAPGNLIGLTSIPLSQNTFQYTASAYVNTTAELIDINIIRKLIHENCSFAAAIIDNLCEVSVQKNSRFFCLTHRQSYGKLADVLLCLAGNVFKTTVFNLDLSRKELAELSGMSTESVIRTLKHFHDDGLIQMDGKSFKIVDPDGLYRVCQLG